MPIAFFKNLFKRRAKPIRHGCTRGRSRLVFDILEDRVLLHATVTAFISAPPSVLEGQAISLIGNANSTNPVDQSAGFDYSWVIKDHNGATVASRDILSTGIYRPDNFTLTLLSEGTYSASLVATEQDGITNSPPALAAFVVADAPPTIASDHPSVSVPETGTAINTGTFADYDDPVTITASQGTVIQDNQNGSWLWAQVGLDEGNHPVTITATNADGTVSTTTFVAHVTDVAPVVTTDHLTVSSPENGTATNTGTWSDYDDGVTLAASQGTVTQHNNGTWSWAQGGDEDASGAVIITATNADGTTAFTAFHVGFSDVAPRLPPIMLRSRPLKTAQPPTPALGRTLTTR